MNEKNLFINGRFLTQRITGVQRFGYEMSRALAAIRSDIVILKPAVLQNDQFDTKSLTVEDVGKNKSHIWEQYDLSSYLKKIKSPLLLNFCSTAPLFYHNQIVTIHDLAYLHKGWHSWPFRKFYSFLLPRIANRAKHILTVSQFSKNEIIKNYKISPEKISVIYNGVSEAALSPLKKDFLDLHDNIKFILSVGSIDPRKNLSSLIKAYLKTNLQFNGIKLYLIGKKNKNFAEDRELYTLINNNDNIRFLGYCSDIELQYFYKNAQIFVYPSLYEGFGLPPVEAMANQCPVLTSDTASLPEVCGEAAVYCDPYSVDDIAQKIQMLIFNEQLKKQLIQKGLQRAKLYTWEKSAQKLSELLSKIESE